MSLFAWAPPNSAALLSAAMAFASVAPEELPDDDFSPAAFFAFLVVCAVCLVLIGIGVVVAIALAALGLLLVALGMVSTSALIALFRRRFSAGLRAFHYQLFGVVTAPCGVVALWMGSSLFQFHWRHRHILLFGSLAGMAAGLLLAFALDQLIRFAYRRISAGSALLP